MFMARARRFRSGSNTATRPNNFPAMEEISVHSPVTLDVYDSQGRHTGPIPGGDSAGSGVSYIQNQIPNSYYLPFGEGHYVGLPADTKGNVKLSGQAAGTFTLDINTGAYKTEFKDVPVLPMSTASFGLASTSPSLLIDYDGDGTIDDVLPPATTTILSGRLGLLKRFIGVFNLPDPAKVGTKDDLETFLTKIRFRAGLHSADKLNCLATIKTIWEELAKAEKH